MYCKVNLQCCYFNTMQQNYHTSYTVKISQLGIIITFENVLKKLNLSIDNFVILEM